MLGAKAKTRRGRIERYRLKHGASPRTRTRKPGAFTVVLEERRRRRGICHGDDWNNTHVRWTQVRLAPVLLSKCARRYRGHAGTNRKCNAAWLCACESWPGVRNFKL